MPAIAMRATTPRERHWRLSVGTLALILENPEIGGRGVREVATALAIAGIFLGSVPTAEAGLFSRRAKSTHSEKATKAAKTNASKIRADIDKKILEQAKSQ